MTERNQFTPSQLEWLSGLESGAFKQGRNYLFRKGDGEKCGHCCLGVRAEQMNLCVDKTQDMHRFGEAREDMEAPAEVVDDLQLYGACGEFVDDHAGRSSLTDMNDSGEYTFAQIAAFIRANPWQVFKNFDRPAGA